MWREAEQLARRDAAAMRLTGPDVEQYVHDHRESYYKTLRRPQTRLAPGPGETHDEYYARAARGH